MKSKILVMDTSTSFTSPWKKGLGEKFEITEVIGGFEAVMKLKSGIYSAIIINISIDHLNGVDAIRKIRDKYSSLPVIVLYDIRDTLNLRQTKAYGIQHALSLPVTSDNIMASLAQFISIPPDVDEMDMSSSSAESTETKKDYVDVEAKFYDALSAIAANGIDDAITIYQELINLSNIKRERWLKYVEESFFHLGQCYARKGDFDKSNRYYIEFINKAPYHNCVKEALLYLGKNHEEMRDFQKASYYYKKVINMRPFDSFTTQARKLLKKIVKV